MDTNFTVKAYYVFMFMLPLVFSSEIADTGLLPRQLFLSTFTLLLAGSVWKTAQSDSRFLKIDAVNLALMVYLLLSAFVSFINTTVLSETLYVLSKLWIVVSLSILTGMLLKNNVIKEKHIIISVVIFGCVSIGTALVDITEKTLRGKHLLHWANTISGGFGNKNLLSSILFLCIPFFMVGLRKERRFKIISCSALVFALFILVVLRTRIVMIATFVFFGIIAFFYLKHFMKRQFWIIAGALVALIFVTLGGVFGKLNVPVDIKRYCYSILRTHTLEERINFWRNSLDMVLEYPFGVGLGNWQIYFPKYGLDKFDSFNIINGISTLQRPHNDFLWSLCETGILGFAVFLSIFGIVVYKSFRLIKTATDSGERWSFICWFSGLIGFLMVAFFDFPMERMEHWILLVLLYAVVIHQDGIKNKASFSVQVRTKFIMIFLVLGISFSFTVAYCRFAAEKQVYKMYTARTDGNPDQVLAFAQQAESFFYEIDSKTIPLEWYKGVANFSKQQYQESEVDFENAYALTPYNIHVINNLASCKEINGKRKEAIKLYAKALQISPGFVEARLNLAAVYYNNKEYNKAFTTIDYCSVETGDPKYKAFLPPILKSKADMILKAINFPAVTENPLNSLQDYSPIYYESKKNNITFEKQIIRHLKK